MGYVLMFRWAIYLSSILNRIYTYNLTYDVDGLCFKYFKSDIYIGGLCIKYFKSDIYIDGLCIKYFKSEYIHRT